MPNVTKTDLRHLLNTIQDALEELRLLEQDKEWFVSDVIDQLKSSEQLILERLNEEE